MRWAVGRPVIPSCEQPTETRPGRGRGGLLSKLSKLSKLNNGTSDSELRTSDRDEAREG